MRSQILAYLAVLLGGAMPWLEVAVVIPAGIVYGLNPILVALLACVGNVATLLVLLGVHRWVGERLRRRGKAPRERSSRTLRAQRIFDRWGMPGLALVAPISIGTHTAAVLAASLGPSRERVATWMSVGVLIWAVLITLVALVGVEWFTSGQS